MSKQNLDAISIKNTERNSAPIFRIAFVAAIGGFLFGFDLGMIGTANVYLEEQFQLSPSMLGWVTASAVLGCIMGPFLGSWLCDSIGRKRTMIIAACLLAISAIFTAFPDFVAGNSNSATMWSFNLFRIIGGVGVGLCSIASPMYIAELAPPSKRGRLGLMYQLAIVTGHAVAPAIAYVIVLVLRTRFGVEEGVIPQQTSLQAWRWMFFSETVCVLAFLYFVVGLPLSPRWLAQKSRFDDAHSVLSGIGGNDFADFELALIKDSMEEEQGSWSDLLAPGMRYALLIGILLAFFNNWTGWSVIGGYVPRLFEAAGFGRESAIRDYIFIYGAMGGLTLVSIFLSDKVGRRPLWIIASVLAMFITAACGFVFHWNLTGTVVLVVIALITVPHGLALGGIPWLMMSELFPTNLRAKAVAITTTILWTFIFTGVYLFPTIINLSERLTGSSGGAFWLFTVICFLSLLFGIFVMPETKGRSLEEIARSWKNK